MSYATCTNCDSFIDLDSDEDALFKIETATPGKPSLFACCAACRKKHPTICTSCGHACETSIVDQGLGAYEFWGFKGHDVHKVLVSNCCEAEVVDPLSHKIIYAEDVA